MMRFVLGLVAALPAMAHGAEPDHCTLVDALGHIVQAETGLAPPGGCPRIERTAFEPGVQDQAGSYDLGNGTIQLAEALDLSDPFGQSVLLHELVHAAQIRAGQHRKVACLAALEAEAYAVQASFLRRAERFDDARMVMSIGLFASICPGDFTY